jgi:hypothetical protein
LRRQIGDLPYTRAVEIFTRLRHPDLQSAQETLKEIENSLVE